MKSRLGADAMVGCAAKAMEALAPEGHVLVEGEIWRAVASEPVPAERRCAWWDTSRCCCRWNRLSSNRPARVNAAGL